MKEYTQIPMPLTVQEGYDLISKEHKAKCIVKYGRRWGLIRYYLGLYQTYDFIKQELTQEDIVIELSVKLWNEFLNVKDKHPDDENDFRQYVHRIQEMMMSSLYRKNNNVKKL